jgi:hypothetical protein
MVVGAIVLFDLESTLDGGGSIALFGLESTLDGGGSIALFDLESTLDGGWGYNTIWSRVHFGWSVEL